jgi:hypothetical protein
MNQYVSLIAEYQKKHTTCFYLITLDKRSICFKSGPVLKTASTIRYWNAANPFIKT